MGRIPSLLCTLLFFLFISAGYAQPGATKSTAPKFDLSKDPVLYTVGYAHLDTEWRWDYETTIREYLPATLDDNFSRLDKYKQYVFTFSGARRYRMMKEYYPERYEKLKRYIAQGRWFVGGSSVDECDVNVPSPESVIRQVLYGNRYFKSEFGKESVDFLLPDCFGFPAHLPSVLAHAGVLGFSTQKLSWGSAAGIPFNLGRWNGPDGNGIVAALNATDYTGRIKPRLDTAAYWVDRVLDNGRKYGVFADYRYYGVGDVGGAPREEDVKNAIGSVGQPDGKINVYLTSSDQLFRDLSLGQKNQLPAYSGDLLLTEHSAGSLTSQAYMKRWNRNNEQLALAAEPLSVMADWLGAFSYPKQSFNEAWWLVLGSQMHDILPGTSIPKAYEYAWNDEILALNRFSALLESAAGAVIRAMDTRGTGKTLVVYNPLAIARKDLVEAEITYSDGAPEAIRAFDTAGMEVPVQVLSATREKIKILLLCQIPALTLQCYDIRPAEVQPPVRSTLSSTKNTISNEFYKITVNASGDVSSIIDKRLGKELLSSPMRLEFQKEHPRHWPAWNMDWDDRKKTPVGFVGGPATISVVENGPVRATLKIVRQAMNSEFTQFIQLAAGKESVLVKNIIHWQSRGVSLKASFPLTASNGTATYNLGLGTIERANNDEKKYEVPSREWFDLTDRTGNFGVTVIEDCKFGSDKPNDRTLRLTLLHTPTTNAFHDQATQDWGIHEVTYGLYSHKGDWRTALPEWQGRALNQPLRVFEATQHPGFLGRSFSFARVSVPQVDIRSIKQAENGKDIVIRLQELTGREIPDVEVAMVSKILKAWELDGQERLIGEAVVKNGKLVLDMKKFAIRTFALQLEPPADSLTEPATIELPLAFDQDVVSASWNRKNGRFDAQGKSFPAALFPEKLVVDGIPFNLGPKADGKNNVVTCRGQKITLPKTGNYNRLYILAAALTDTTGTFRAGGQKTTLGIQAYHGSIGRFDKRTWDPYGRIEGLETGFIKRDQVAWFATHLHHDTAVLPHQYGYIYKYSLEAGPASGTIQLPDNESIKIFAISLSANPYDHLRALAPLYDDFTGREALQLTLPKSYVKASMAPAMEIERHTHSDLYKLPARLTMRDYADLHQPNGVMASYYYSGADSTLTGSPTLTGSILDGMFELMPSDSLNDKWSETGEGRIFIDLQKEIEIDSVHMFSSQSTKRKGQSFSMWGATGQAQSAATGDPVSAGWQFLAFVPPGDIWGERKVLYTVKPLPGQPQIFRYLLWISEDSPHGPFYFREVDVFEKQK